MKKISLTLIMIFSFGILIAQDNEKTEKQNIFNTLTAKDSTSGATVKVYQDKRIEQILADRRSSGNAGSSRAIATTSGYRVQVFSSNTQRTAKTEAFKIEKDLLEIYPEQAVYVNYTSPFWKVRIGDFKNMDEAQKFRSELIKVFPNLRNETYTVKDQINY